mmetsp:Transcript_54031/g.101353  ORF Transcript_54031/g.101353 Transcript_54031/m.101353 type:complete len:347 (+) Transcript_54031:61-1101(+)
MQIQPGPRPKRRRFEFQATDLVLKLLVSPDVAGKIIGTGGAEAKALRAQSGVTLHIWENKFLGTGLQVVVLGGPRASVEQAVMLVGQKMAEESQTGTDVMSVSLLLTRNSISKIIGAKGAMIGQLRQEFTCNLEAEKDVHFGEQVLRVSGPSQMVQHLLVRLVELVEEAGDSLNVANNDYAPGPGYAPMTAGYAPMGGKDGYNPGPQPWVKGKGASPFQSGKGMGPPAKGLAMRPKGGGPSGPYGAPFGGSLGNHPEPHGDLVGADQDPVVLSTGATIQFAIPADSVSRVLGKGGLCSKEITRHTGAKLVIEPAQPGADAVVTLTGQVGGVNRAHCMIVSRLLAEY